MTVFLLFYFHFVFVFIFIFPDLVDFTDEEGYGKYLDLHECYEKYINLRGVEVRF